MSTAHGHPLREATAVLLAHLTRCEGLAGAAADPDLATAARAAAAAARRELSDLAPDVGTVLDLSCVVTTAHGGAK